MIEATDGTRGDAGLSAARQLLRRCCSGPCAGDGHACDRAPSPGFPELECPGHLDPAGPLAPDVQTAIERVTSEPLLGGDGVRLLAEGTEFYSAMLELVDAARDELQFENFIFRADAVVRDRREAVVGGMCLADVWLGNCIDRCTWKDGALLIRGPAAGRCGRAFDRLWSGAARRGRDGGPPGASPEVASREGLATSMGPGEVPVRVIPGAPGDGRLADVLEAVFAAARAEILVTNPYLVPPARILAALTGAARRGVRVHVLVPGRNNHRVAGLASEQLQGELLRAGVRVSRWSGPMLHAKCVVVDRRWSLVGSSNLDSLSLRRTAELDVAAYGPAFGRQMADLFEGDLARSERYGRNMWEGASAARRAARRLSAVLRPWRL